MRQENHTTGHVSVSCVAESIRKIYSGSCGHELRCQQYLICVYLGRPMTHIRKCEECPYRKLCSVVFSVLQQCLTQFISEQTLKPVSRHCSLSYADHTSSQLTLRAGASQLFRPWVTHCPMGIKLRYTHTHI